MPETGIRTAEMADMTTDGPLAAKAAALFQTFTQAALVFDATRCLAWCNAAGAQLLGASLDQLNATPFDTLCVGDPVQTLPGGRHVTHWRQADGGLIRADTLGWPLQDETGAQIGQVVLLTPLSRLPALAQVLARLTALSYNRDLCEADRIDAMLQLGCESLGAQVAQISLARSATVTVVYGHDHGAPTPPGEQIPLADSLCRRALLSNGPLLIEDLGKPHPHPALPDTGVRRYLGMPLLVGGERIGTLSFFSPAPGTGGSEAARTMLPLFAAWIAQELSLPRIYRRLEDTADRDWLTGAETRHEFDQALVLLYELSRETREGAGLILFDLDQFRAVNEAHGHVAGDHVLHRVIETARDVLQDEGALYRVGDEEFAILTPCADPAWLQRKARALRNGIAASGEEGSGEVPMTASFGISPLDPARDTLTDWRHRADLALHHARQAGPGGIHMLANRPSLVPLRRGA